ncbi:MAG: prepilin peptidase [Planctomycetota bacterium]
MLLLAQVMPPSLPEEYLFFSVLACAAVLGGCVGSFLNVCIYRLPHEELSVREPRWSFCPLCKARIRWFDNVPVFGWLWLGGKCRDCKAKIAIRYPLVEAMTAGFFVLAVLHAGAPAALPEFGWLPEAIYWALLFAALLVVTFVDLDHRIIPDDVSITGSAVALLPPLFCLGVPVHPDVPQFLLSALRALNANAVDSGVGVAASISVALVFGAIAAYLFKRYSPRWDGGVRKWWETRLAFAVGASCGGVLASLFLIPGWLDTPAAQRFLAALFGMGVGAGALYSVGVLGKIAFKKDAMGLGDVKLMALLGAALGWKGVLLAIFVACLLGSVIGIAVKLITRSSYIPFGPFLAAGAMILILWHQQVDAALDWYVQLIRGDQ